MKCQQYSTNGLQNDICNFFAWNYFLWDESGWEKAGKRMEDHS